MSGMRTSDYGRAEAGGEKYQRAEKARRPASKIEKAEKSKKKKHEKSRKKSLILAELSVIIIFRDTSFLAPELKAGARDQKEVNTMNKYELAVVLSASLCVRI